MLARNPLLTSLHPIDLPLAELLDDFLATLPSVTAVGLDPVIESLLPPLRLPTLAIVCRRIRFADGVRLTVLAVPDANWHRRSVKSGLGALRRAAGAIGREVVPLSESWLENAQRFDAWIEPDNLGAAGEPDHCTTCAAWGR